MTQTQFFFPYQYRTTIDLTTEERNKLIRLFENPPMDLESVLAGRTQVVRTQLEPVGPVVIKYYKRGGLIRHVMKNAYLRSGTPRSRLEFDMLEKVRGLGVSSPEPVLWATRGGMFYRSFLITRDIGPHRSLVDLSQEDEATCAEAIHKASDQIRRLIRNRIHHVDLHPGNILMSDQGQVFIIDFDKARVSTKPEETLQKTYLRRWLRAVKKHNLPTVLAEQMTKELTALSA